MNVTWLMCSKISEHLRDKKIGELPPHVFAIGDNCYTLMKRTLWVFFINNNKNNTNNGNNRNTLMKRTLWVSSWITIMDLPCPSSHHVSNSQDLRHHICKFAKLPIFACSCPSQCLLNCFLPLGFLNQLIQAVPDFTHICVYDTSVIVSTNSVTCKHLY